MIIIPPPKKKRPEKEVYNLCAKRTFNDLIYEINLHGVSKLKKSKKRFIIYKYISLMKHAILHGEQWNLPGDVGSIAVIRETDNNKSEIAGYKKFKKKFGFDFFGNKHSIEMASINNHNLGYTFCASAPFISQLQRMLNDKNIDYRTQLT